MLPKILHPDFKAGRKPTGAVEIDWNNPLTRGLRFYPLLGLPGLIPDLVSGARGDILGSASFAVDPLGRAMDFDGRVNFASVKHGITTGALTIACLFRWDGTAQNWQTLLSINDNLGLYLPKYIGSHYMAADSVTMTSVDWTGATVAANEVGLFAYSVPGSASTGEGYKNGINIGTSSAAFTYDSLGGVSDIDIGYGQGGETGHGKMLFCAVWDRVLTDREHFSLAKNPYQLLKPATVYSFPTAVVPVGNPYYYYAQQ